MLNSSRMTGSDLAYINPVIIRALAKALSDESVKVRETVASIIGRIGMPEAITALNPLAKILSSSEEDPNVKSLAIWTIGRIGPEAFHKVKKPLIISSRPLISSDL